MANSRQLQSDTLPGFYPDYVSDLTYVGTPRKPTNHERAAATYGLLKNWQITRDGQEDIKTGADTFKYWEQATTQRDVYMALRTVISAAFWVEGKVVPKNDYKLNPGFEDFDKRLITLIEKTFKNFCYQSLTDSLIDLMLYGNICGFAVGEKVWAAQDGEWILQAIKTKPSYDFTPIVDQWYNLYEVWHYPTGRAYHPGAFIWAPWPRIMGGKWMGMSELQSIRHDLLLLSQLEAIQAKNATILSRSPVIDEVIEDDMSKIEIATHRTKVEELLAGKGNGVIHMPATLNNKQEFNSTFRLSVMDNRTGSEAMSAAAVIIDEKQKQIKRALGTPDDIGNTTVTGGSWAKAQTTFNLLIARAEDGQRWIQDIMNRQVISDIIFFNFPNLPPGFVVPCWEYPEIKEEFNTQKAEYVKTLLESGILTANKDDISWARDFLGLPPLPAAVAVAPMAGQQGAVAGGKV